MVLRLLEISLFFTAVFTAIGFLVGSIWGLWFSFLLGIVFLLVSLLMNAMSYVYASRMILKKYNAKPSDDNELNDIADMMALNAKIPKPKVYMIPVDVPNSFATGTSKTKAMVCVTEGVLSMNRGEKENIIAHEIRHIANNDILVQNFAVTTAGILHKTRILTPLAIAIVRISLSERREYAADYYASRYSGKPKDLASALNKISETARQNPMKGSPAFEGIWIINPFKREGLGLTFSTHPPTARRVKRVEEMAHEGMPEAPEATEVE
jgi:heat shock protein HtpX